jgi:ascorbate-specific PTS system EIIC-type component UlaA
VLEFSYILNTDSILGGVSYLRLKIFLAILKIIGVIVVFFCRGGFGIVNNEKPQYKAAVFSRRSLGERFKVDG